MTTDHTPHLDRYFIHNTVSTEVQYMTFLHAIVLHKNKHINRKKLLAIFKKVNDKSILVRKNLHHCSITDNWFEKESLYNVTYEAMKNLVTDPEITIEDLVNYSQLLLNKPRNYCLDWVRDQILKPVTNYAIGCQALSSLTSFHPRLIVFEQNMEFYCTNSSYCCEDCDGPEELSNELTVEAKKELHNMVADLLNPYRKYRKI